MLLLFLDMQRYAVAVGTRSSGDWKLRLAGTSPLGGLSVKAVRTTCPQLTARRIVCAAQTSDTATFLIFTMSLDIN